MTLQEFYILLSWGHQQVTYVLMSLVAQQMETRAFFAQVTEPIDAPPYDEHQELEYLNPKLSFVLWSFPPRVRLTIQALQYMQYQ